MNEVWVAIITGIVSIIAGGGGVFAYLKSKNKAKLDEHSMAVSEWKDLYDEMKERLDKQEKENEELKSELIVLKEEISKLTIELQNYKKYDTYINNLERYVEHLLHSFKTLATDEAYQNMLNKKPEKLKLDPINKKG